MDFFGSERKSREERRILRAVELRWLQNFAVRAVVLILLKSISVLDKCDVR